MDNINANIDYCKGMIKEYEMGMDRARVYEDKATWFDGGLYINSKRSLERFQSILRNLEQLKELTK